MKSEKVQEWIEKFKKASNSFQPVKLSDKDCADFVMLLNELQIYRKFSS